MTVCTNGHAGERSPSYREAAAKPEPTMAEIWASMWVRQRSAGDLRLITGQPGDWHPALADLFVHNPEVQAAIPDAARAELRRRGLPEET